MAWRICSRQLKPSASIGGLTVKTAHRRFRAGTRSLIVRDRRMRGRYRVEIVAADLADNHSRVKHARVTVG